MFSKRYGMTVVGDRLSRTRANETNEQKGGEYGIWNLAKYKSKSQNPKLRRKRNKITLTLIYEYKNSFDRQRKKFKSFDDDNVVLCCVVSYTP